MIYVSYEYLFYFREVIECDEFLSSPYESVVELISSDKLQVSSEEKVSNFMYRVLCNMMIKLADQFLL